MASRCPVRSAVTVYVSCIAHFDTFFLIIPRPPRSTLFPYTPPFRSNNKEAASGCGDEPITVGQASPSITTSQQPATGTARATINVKATLASLFAAHPTGKVSWKLSDNKDCSSAKDTLVASDNHSALP